MIFDLDRPFTFVLYGFTSFHFESARPYGQFGGLLSFVLTLNSWLPPSLRFASVGKLGS